MKISTKIFFRSLIVLHCLIFQLACASSQPELAASKEEVVKSNSSIEGSTRSAAKVESDPCKNKKDNIYVYPANDGFPHSQGASGKPTKYCDENDLFQKKPDLLKKDQKN